MEQEIADSGLALTSETIPTKIRVSWPVRSIACLLLSDNVAIMLSLAAASLIRNVVAANPATPIPGTMLAALLLVVCSLIGAGLYSGVSANPVEELRSTTLAITLAFLLLWTATLFLHDLSQSRLIYGLAYLFSVMLIPMGRSAVRNAFANCTWWGHAVAILGFGDTGRHVFEILKKNPRIGLRPVAILDDSPAVYLKTGDMELVRGPLTRCLEIAQEQKISYGIVCMPSLSRGQLLGLVDRYGSCFGHVLVIPDLIGMTSLGICAREVGGVVGLEVKQQLLRPWSQFVKRGLDIAIAVTTTPFVMLVVAASALLIRLESPGPIFYGNERIGRGGRTFRAWKLRSMVTDGDEILKRYLEANPEAKEQWEATQKLPKDPRLTRVGRLIRKMSIDELPQLWNVLMGEMSVVGPRPVLSTQIPMYGASFNLYRQVRPGMTGLWQVSGRNRLTFADRVKLDKYVIQNWSVWLDLYILIRTISVVLTANGAY
jgi:Undecaprenyl-phosphate galactose phosphotransferase WbaP